MFSTKGLVSCVTCILFIAFFFLQSTAFKAQSVIPPENYCHLDTLQPDGLKLRQPSRVRFDQVNNLLFVSDPGLGSIFSIDLATNEWTEVFNKKNAKPDYITLDPDLKILYWTDSRTAEIWRANYDGSLSMPIYSRKNDYPGVLHLDKNSERLIWLDKKSNYLKSVSTVGSGPRLLYQTSRIVIRSFALSQQEGFVYLAVENNPSATLDFKTIFLLDTKNRSSVPVVKNCTNAFSRLLFADGKLLWTSLSPAKIYFFDVNQNLLQEPQYLKHNILDLDWDIYNDRYFYTVEKEKYVFSCGKKMEKIDDILSGVEIVTVEKQIDSLLTIQSRDTTLATVLTDVSSVEDSVAQEEKVLPGEVAIPEIDETNRQTIGTSPEKTKTYARIYRVKLRLKNGKSDDWFLYGMDEKNLFVLSSFYMKNDVPVFTQQDDLFNFPLAEIDMIKILRYYDIELTGAMARMAVKNKSEGVQNLIIGGLGGFGIDLLLIAAGAFSFPTFTMWGGMAGLIYSAYAYARNNNSMRAEIAGKKSVNITIHLKTGIKEADKKLLSNYLFRQVENTTVRNR